MFNQDALGVEGFSWDVALSLAQASELAYHPDQQGIEQIATQTWGFDGCRVCETGNILGFVAWNRHCVVIAFRGTKSVSDWLSNLDVLPVTQGYGKVHAGFFEGFDSVRNQVESALREASGSATNNDQRIWLAGHSLGGALATVAMVELGASNARWGLYTYGQPKSVDSETSEFFSNAFNQQICRFVNDDDIVCKIPPGYQHVGQLFWFDPRGQLIERDPALEAVDVDITEDEFARLQTQIKKIKTAIENESSIQAKALEGVDSNVTDLLDASVEGIFPSFQDHRITNYIKQIRKHVRSDIVRESLIEQKASTTRSVTRSLESSATSPRSSTRSAVSTRSLSGSEGDSVPVLLRVRNAKWQAPEGLKIQSRLGTVISASVSKEQIESLEYDEDVLSIEASREGGSIELDQSVPFIRAHEVSVPPLDEKGDSALVGIIDAGIDVLHEAFRDGVNQTRIKYVWDQRTQTPGATPNDVNAVFRPTYGTLYQQSDIQEMIDGVTAMPPNLRDRLLHGTHVASIAAGRKVGAFAGGVAPEAGLVVVIPHMSTSPGDPPSIGYSSSHADALEFVRNAATELALPIAVNVSLGMNAGAHDGSSTLEAAFDEFTGLGREPGIVLVKSAGNERSHKGHAKAEVSLGAFSEITWDSLPDPRTDDYFEFWFHKFDDVEFTLEDPSGNTSPTVSSAQPITNLLLGGNECELELIRNHRDNGDNLLRITILRDSQSIQVGKWKLKMLGLTIRGDGVVHGWVERDRARAVSFQSGDNDEMTLSIPGTAEHVITVAACGSTLPIQLTATSSWGLTRDGRTKPDLCAPGTSIAAAKANQANHQGVMPMTGTSMAAPHVTGSIALVLSRLHKDPNKMQANANQIRTALITSAKNFTGLHNKGVGYGALDTLDFVKQF